MRESPSDLNIYLIYGETRFLNMILSRHDSVSRFSLFPFVKSVFICVHPPAIGLNRSRTVRLWSPIVAYSRLKKYFPSALLLQTLIATPIAAPSLAQEPATILK